MKEFKIKSSDGVTELACFAWEPAGEVKAVLQIVHGMSEYVLRYAGFAEYCAQEGILVVGDDHLGHGQSAPFEGDLGFFGSDEGWKRLIDDEHILRQTMQEQYPDLPYVIMGHSMGSFIVRNYITRYNTDGLAGCVIMGTAGSNPAIAAGKALTSLIIKTKGERHRSKLITAMAFGSYSKKIKDPVNHYAWLTRDNDICLRYAKDPFCRFTFTAAGYLDLFRLIDNMSKKEWYACVSASLPILIVSGGADPVGDYGKGPAEVAEKLEAEGCDVNMLIYEGMRHEVLNEIGREVVFEDVRSFVLDCCGLLEEAETDGEAE